MERQRRVIEQMWDKLSTEPKTHSHCGTNCFFNTIKLDHQTCRDMCSRNLSFVGQVNIILCLKMHLQSRWNMQTLSEPVYFFCIKATVAHCYGGFGIVNMADYSEVLQPYRGIQTWLVQHTCAACFDCLNLESLCNSSVDLSHGTLHKVWLFKMAFVSFYSLHGPLM